MLTFVCVKRFQCSLTFAFTENGKPKMLGNFDGCHGNVREFNSAGEYSVALKYYDHVSDQL